MGGDVGEQGRQVGCLCKGPLPESRVVWSAERQGYGTAEQTRRGLVGYAQEGAGKGCSIPLCKVLPRSGRGTSESLRVSGSEPVWVKS